MSLLQRALVPPAWVEAARGRSFTASLADGTLRVAADGQELEFQDVGYLELPSPLTGVRVASADWMTERSHRFHHPEAMRGRSLFVLRMEGGRSGFVAAARMVARGPGLEAGP